MSALAKLRCGHSGSSQRAEGIRLCAHSCSPNLQRLLQLHFLQAFFIDHGHDGGGFGAFWMAMGILSSGCSWSAVCNQKERRWLAWHSFASCGHETTRLSRGRFWPALCLIHSQLLCTGAHGSCTGAALERNWCAWRCTGIRLAIIDPSTRCLQVACMQQLQQQG